MKNCIIKSKKYLNIQLRSIEERDLENLRIWKNENKASFFFQDYITASMQKQWYENYLKEDNGYMFIVEECREDISEHPIGCMGYRFCENEIDLYNIIRGKKSEIHQTMYSAMYILLSVLSHPSEDVTCKVLKKNPALDWYFHMGFRVKNIAGGVFGVNGS